MEKELITININENKSLQAVYKLENNSHNVTTYEPLIAIEDLPQEIQGTATEVWTQEVLDSWEEMGNIWLEAQN